MKYLAIILILFAVPVFAADYDKDFPPLGAEICYTIDISPLNHEPEPVEKSAVAPKFIQNFKKDPGTFILDWATAIGVALENDF